MERPRYDFPILLRARGIFRPLVDRLKLAKLQSERAQVSKDSRKRLLASGVSEEEASRSAIRYHKGDFRVTHSNIVVFLSDRLIEKAECLQVPVPQDEKYWTQLKYALHIHLSEEGQAELRKRTSRRRRVAKKGLALVQYNCYSLEFAGRSSCAA
jgi:hypothetical protein